MSAPPVTFRRRAFVELSADALYEILQLRGDVFVVEQGIHAENDLDGNDRAATHVLGRAPDGRLVATARLHLESSPVVVSRIAVARDWRGRGVGSALMHYIGENIGPCPACMSAQATLERWYRRFGWIREGTPYDEVGIEHVRLVRGQAARPAPGEGPPASRT